MRLLHGVVAIGVVLLPVPAVSAHLLNAVLSFPAEFIFRFGSIGVAGCDIAGAAWLDFIRNCFAAGFFVSLDNIEYAVAFAGAEQVDATLLTDPSEMDLIRMLAAFPQEIVMAAEKYDPSRINRFVIDLASAFHRFYGNCRIQGADPAVQQARLALCIGVKNVIFNVLTMFKINVPEKM